MPVKMTILMENGVEFNVFTPNQESADKVADKFNEKAVAAYDTETILLTVRGLRKAGFSVTKINSTIEYEKDGVMVDQSTHRYSVYKPGQPQFDRIFLLDQREEMVGYALRLLSDG